MLRERLWEPIETKLQDAKIVLLSPDGALGRLPLGALPGKESGKYLIEERTMAIVPVPQLIPDLIQETGRKQLQKNLLLMGNVDYDLPSGDAGRKSPVKPRQFGRVRGEGIVRSPPPLPGTRAKSLRSRRCTASRSAVRSLRRWRSLRRTGRPSGPRRAAQYLHIATHGFFAPASQRSALASPPPEASRFGEMVQGMAVGGLHPGLLSGLALAGANRVRESAVSRDPDADDGIVTAEEIGTMNLDGVELVMLSACARRAWARWPAARGCWVCSGPFSRAGGADGRGQSVESAGRGDAAAHGTLYQNHWQKDLSVLEALRDAQLTLLHEGRKRGVVREDKLPSGVDPTRSPPYYWAAFVLSGDWR